MSAPTDPDTEDRRPERDREPDELEERDPYDDEDERLDEVVGDNQLGLFDDDLLELSLDDLKDMDGPDA
jgi:hypothetical protein